MTIFLLLIRSLALATEGALLWSTTALAAYAGFLAESQARYRQDMAVCNSENQTNRSLCAVWKHDMPWPRPGATA